MRADTLRLGGIDISPTSSFFKRKPKLSKDVYWIATATKALAITEKSVYHTTQWGKTVLMLCDGSRTVTSILDEIVRIPVAHLPTNADVKMEQRKVVALLKKEIRGFLEAMQREGLIVYT